MTMKRILIADSSADLNPALTERLNVRHVPFPINVGGKEYLDDGSMDIPEFIQTVKASSEAAKTAAPPPAGFEAAMEDAEESFIVTISSKLSTTYVNACLAAREVMEKGLRRVHVFDSRSASVGETAVCAKLREWMDAGLGFDEIVRRGEAFIESLHTYFVLEDLSTLVKAGRIPKLAGKLAKRLSIVPVCAGIQGEIKVHEIKRGVKSALNRMSAAIGESLKDFSDRTLYIAHVNCPERAEEVRGLVLEKANFADCQIVAARGLSTTYANDGGIIVAY